MKPPSDQWEIMPLFSTPLYLAQDIITPEILQQVKDLDYIDDIKQYNTLIRPPKADVMLS